MPIQPFELGRWDVPTRVVMPNRLYGRKAEVRSLLNSFEQVSTGQTQLTLVAGPSGVGKTALIQELYPTIAQQNGRFIQGKFDQVNRNIPFSAFIQACQTLVAQLQSEPDEALADWRQRLLDVLGNVGQVMIEVVPELAQIIGPQPAVPKLSGEANRNRFNRVVTQFIQVFAEPGQPLVLFLDDLQWADDTSLKLLNTLMTNHHQKVALLVLGAYRDNEVSPDHPLTPLIKQLTEGQRNPGQITTLAINPLTVDEVSQWLADMLMCPLTQTEPLAKWVIYKTKGNPFFVSQFIRRLEKEDCFWFDQEAGHWKFNLKQVGELGIDEDSLAFTLYQLNTLPLVPRRWLTLAAFLGNRFSLNSLAIITQTKAFRLNTELWPAIQAGFIISTQEADSAFQKTIPDKETVENGYPPVYQFVHDQIQQAAYNLTPAEQQQQTHYQIGQALLNSEAIEQNSDMFFAMVNHLNKGADLITDSSEHQKLIQLNMEACMKAQGNTAYATACQYALIAKQLWGEDIWQTDYAMGLQLHNTLAELYLLMGEFEAMDKVLNRLIQQSETLLAQIKAHRIRIQSCFFQNQMENGLSIGIDILNQLGVNISLHPTEQEVNKFIQRGQKITQGVNIPDLIDHPVMEEPKALAITEIASNILTPAFLTNPSLFIILVNLLVELSIRYGNTTTSAHNYGAYGVLACNLFKDIETGITFGRLAAALDEMPVCQALQGRGRLVQSIWLEHRQSPLRKTLDSLVSGYQMAQEVGDLEFLGHNAYIYCVNAFWAGCPLSSLEPKVSHYVAALVKVNQSVTENYMRLVDQVCLNLLGKTQTPCILTGSALDETEWVKHLLATGNVSGLCFFHFYKFFLGVLFNEFSLATYHREKVQDYFSGFSGLILEANYHFYDSLLLLATVNFSSQQDALEQVEKNQATLQQDWADHAPMNFQHKVDLVAAEKCRVLGDCINAIDLYDRAIARATANDYIQEAALANELAAKFYLAWGKMNFAIIYMQESHRCYTQWGAKAKTTDLEHKYPHLLPNIVSQPSAILPNFSLPPTSGPSATISSYASTMWGLRAADFAPILKSTQVWGQITDLPTLIRQLMQLTLISSGAQTCIISYRDTQNQWQVEASRTGNLHENLHENTSENTQAYPNHLIHWTKNTRVTTLLDRQSPLGIIDPYLLQCQPQSAFCTPILRGENVLGVLYLEHRQAKDIFTQRDQAILSFLCAQVAIAIDNVTLKLTTQPRPNSQTTPAQLDHATLQTTPDETSDVHKEASLSEEQLVELMVSKISIDTTSWVEQVKIALIDLLPQGLCSAEAVADHLNVSPRTLRRRLKQAGTSFQAELSQLRLAFAKHYLNQSDLTNEEIATLLGYRVASSFCRAFNLATGMTPQEFRKNYLNSELSAN